MTKRELGAAGGKYLLLVLALALMGAWIYWKQSYGTIGAVAKLEGSTAGLIAFIRNGVDGESNLWVIRADGTDAKALTADDKPKRSPTWSPDGSRICYAQEERSEGASAYQLFVLGQGKPRQATYGSLSKDLPRWSPDGRRIAYLAGGAIKVVNPNGEGGEQIYPRPHRGQAADADTDASLPPGSSPDEARRPPLTWFLWAPTGQAIAAIQVTEGENAVAPGSANWWQRKGSQDEDLATSSVSEPESVIVLPHLDAEPMVLPGANKVTFDWTPDGRRVVVALGTRKGRHAIAMFRTDEKNLPVEMLLTTSPRTVAPEGPAVSPKGDVVAFELWNTANPDSATLMGIATLPIREGAPTSISGKADLGKLRMLVRGDARGPVWSPDGGSLLFTMAEPSGRNDVWVIRSDGTGATNLTKGQGDNVDARWSPAKR